MKLNQLSLFLENKPGQLKVPCQVLGDAGIDILTMSLADTEQFGILRLIVRDWQKARDLLRAAGVVVKVNEVLALDVEDRPGGLARVLDVLDQAKLAVEYMYAFTCDARGHKAALLFRFENPDAAIAVLKQHGVRVLESEELLARIKG